MYLLWDEYVAEFKMQMRMLPQTTLNKVIYNLKPWTTYSEHQCYSFIFIYLFPTVLIRQAFHSCQFLLIYWMTYSVDLLALFICALCL